MKYAIVYSSKTGNTKFLAESLSSHLKERDCILCETRQANKVDADLYFVGFWTCRGECDKDTKHFLEMLKSKDVFLFGTSGFGESPAYYKKILKRTQKYLNASIKLAGSFMCQGKMPIQIRKKYEKKLNSIFYRMYAKRMVKNYDNALGHPNQQDLKQFFSEIENTLPGLDSCGQVTESKDSK